MQKKSIKKVLPSCAVAMSTGYSTITCDSYPGMVDFIIYSPGGSDITLKHCHGTVVRFVAEDSLHPTRFKELVSL